MNEKKHFTGKIIECKKKKVYDKKSKFYQQTYYKAVAKNENQAENIFIYNNLASSKIINVIKKRNYFEKKYSFTCQKSKWGWILLDWLERQY